jgi:hypothetical protein
VYGPINALARVTKVGLSNTINDPGNADFAALHLLRKR